MNKENEAENSALLLLIKNLQSSKNYRKFKERRINSPHIKQDILFPEDQDQKKWDDLLDKCLSRMEDDALL